MATRLNKHERYLVTLVQGAKDNYRTHEQFLSWLRGFNRPASMRPVLRERLRQFINQ